MGEVFIMRQRWLVLAVLGLAALVSWTPAQDGGKLDIHLEKELVYGQGGGEELKLDLARPPSHRKGRFPAVVCIHGGGWRLGQRQQLSRLTELLASRGFVAVTISYRLAPKHRFPAQIEDCKAATRWLRAQADKYRLNADRIGAVGFSAGGHLACLLGTANGEAGLESNGGNDKYPSRIQAVVSFFGPTDLTARNWSKEVEGFFLVPFLGGSFEEKGDLYRKCSPIQYVSKDAPPFLFFHGDQDPIVNIDQSQKLAQKLQEAGAYAKLVTMEGDGHGWGGTKLNQTLEQTVAFFEEKLKK